MSPRKHSCMGAETGWQIQSRWPLTYAYRIFLHKTSNVLVSALKVTIHIDLIQSCSIWLIGDKLGSVSLGTTFPWFSLFSLVVKTLFLFALLHTSVIRFLRPEKDGERRAVCTPCKYEPLPALTGLHSPVACQKKNRQMCWNGERPGYPESS